MKFSFKNFFSNCDQIYRKLRIWLHLLKKSLMENFIFCDAITNHSRICSSLKKTTRTHYEMFDSIKISMLKESLWIIFTGNKSRYTVGISPMIIKFAVDIIKLMEHSNLYNKNIFACLFSVASRDNWIKYTIILGIFYSEYADLNGKSTVSVQVHIFATNMCDIIIYVAR